VLELREGGEHVRHCFPARAPAIDPNKAPTTASSATNVTATSSAAAHPLAQRHLTYSVPDGVPAQTLRQFRLPKAAASADRVHMWGSVPGKLGIVPPAQFIKLIVGRALAVTVTQLKRPAT
jgi:hypothetical protein